jgi:hypothetical protein
MKKRAAGGLIGFMTEDALIISLMLSNMHPDLNLSPQTTICCCSYFGNKILPSSN